MNKMTAATIVAIMEIRKLSSYVTTVHPDLSIALKNIIQVCDKLDKSKAHYES